MPSIILALGLQLLMSTTLTPKKVPFTAWNTASSVSARNRRHCCAPKPGSKVHHTHTQYIVVMMMMNLLVDVVAISLRLTRVLISFNNHKITLYGVPSINFLPSSRIVSQRAGRDVFRFGVCNAERPSLCQLRLEN